MRLPDGWVAVDRERAAALEAELRRELPAGHRLQGLALTAVASSRDDDDVLFRPMSGGGPFYVVHLTWSVETDPAWPWTDAYDDMDDFLERRPREEMEDDWGGRDREDS